MRAIVTGGSRGIGRAIVNQLVKMDYDVVSIGRSGDKFNAFRLLHLDGRREENRACHGCQYIETLPDNIDQYREVMKNAILSGL